MQKLLNRVMEKTVNFFYQVQVGLKDKHIVAL
jgi:hypothetical protein